MKPIRPDERLRLISDPLKPGEMRTVNRRLVGESGVIALSPLPIPLAMGPLCPYQEYFYGADYSSFLAMNDVYLEIGECAGTTPQYVDRMAKFHVVTLLAIAAVMLGAPMAFLWWADAFGRGHLTIESIVIYSLATTLASWVLFAVPITTDALSDMKRRATSYPIIFNRQRRQVVFAASLERPLIVCPWEKVRAWFHFDTKNNQLIDVEISDFIATTSSLYIGIEDCESGDPYFFKAHETILHRSVILYWEAIRRYMDCGPESLGEIFDKAVQKVSAAAANNPPMSRHRFPMSDDSPASAIAKKISSLLNKKFSRPAHNDISKWLTSLPDEQQVTASPEVIRESARIRYAMSHGHSWLDYLQGNVEVPDELPALYYQEGPLDGPLQPPPDAKRRGKKAAEFKRKAKAHEIARHRKRIDLQRQRAMEKGEG